MDQEKISFQLEAHRINPDALYGSGYGKGYGHPMRGYGYAAGGWGSPQRGYGPGMDSGWNKRGIGMEKRWN